MSTDHIMELDSLRERHVRIGDILLQHFGGMVVLRLGFDPVRQPPGTCRRKIIIDRMSPNTGNKQVEETWEIGWSRLAYLEDHCIRLGKARNELDITEGAAIGVMALLISELENGDLQEVLPIGSGGDYLVHFSRGGVPVQVEVSGIRQDILGAETKSRLAKKSEQVLSNSNAGYVSVTTFHHRSDEGARSCLHYVSSTRNKKRNNKGLANRGRK